LKEDLTSWVLAGAAVGEERKCKSVSVGERANGEKADESF